MLFIISQDGRRRKLSFYTENKSFLTWATRSVLPRQNGGMAGKKDCLVVLPDRGGDEPATWGGMEVDQTLGKGTWITGMRTRGIEQTLSQSIEWIRHNAI